MDFIHSRLLKGEPFLEADRVFKHVPRLQDPATRESTEVVTGPDVIYLFPKIPSTENILIVSGGAVTSALHEGHGVGPNIDDPQSDSNFLPDCEILLGGNESDLEIVARMSPITQGCVKIFCHLFRFVVSGKPKTERGGLVLR